MIPAPPKEAHIDSAHGHFFFIYPKTIPEHYFGCQTTWYETGEKILTYRFEDGLPVIFEEYEKDLLVKLCEIEDKEEIKDVNGVVCPSLDSVNFVLKAHREAPPADYVVPPERDPRR
ncbi:MAG: hypothetical protein LBE62_04770 [Azonexus sp.]|nr:hypothetical protein [Azonexus sp.]